MLHAISWVACVMLYIILLAMLQRLFRWPQVLMWKIFVSILMSFIGLTRAKNIKAFLGNFVISVTVTHEIVRYVSVRWLNLEKAVYRILKLYRSLQSYFRSESEPQARFTRLCTAFDDPIRKCICFCTSQCFQHLLMLTFSYSEKILIFIL